MTSTSVDKTRCIAFGCPCKGTINSSTTGGDKWFCSFHFNRDAIAWQKITAELNRLHWLVGTIQDLRLAYTNTPEIWAEAARAGKQCVVANQRSDLLPAVGESGADWIKRLDHVLAAAVGTAPRPDQVQPGLLDAADPNSFKRVAFPAQQAS